MKRISTISRPRVLEAYVSQGIFLTVLELVLGRALADMSEKGGKPQS